MWLAGRECSDGFGGAVSVVNLADLGMKIAALTVAASQGESFSALIDLRVVGDSVHCVVDPRGGPLAAMEAKAERSRRDASLVTREAIEGALLSLDRLDH